MQSRHGLLHAEFHSLETPCAFENEKMEWERLSCTAFLRAAKGQACRSLFRRYFVCWDDGGAVGDHNTDVRLVCV